MNCYFDHAWYEILVSILMSELELLNCKLCYYGLFILIIQVSLYYCIVEVFSYTVEYRY